MAVYPVAAGNIVAPWRINRDKHGRLYALYSIGFPASELYLAYSDDNGSNWTAVYVGAHAPPFWGGFSADMAIDTQDNVHIVYILVTAANPGNGNVGYHTFTRAAGLSAAINLTDDGWDHGREHSVAIAVGQNDELIVAYSDDRLGGWESIYARQTAAGVWGAETLVITNPLNQGQESLSLTVGNSNIMHMAWNGMGWGANPGNFNVQYMYNDGAWSARIPVTDEPTDQQGSSAVVAHANNHVHFTWQDVQPGVDLCRYRRYIWGTGFDAVEIVENTNSVDAAAISLDNSGNIFVIMLQDIAGTPTVVYREKSNEGTWLTPVVAAADSVVWPLSAYVRKKSGDYLPDYGVGFLYFDTVGNILNFYTSFDFEWYVPPPVVPTYPAVETLPAINISGGGADIRSAITEDNGRNVIVSFEWGVTSLLGNTTPWALGYSKGDIYTYGLGGLKPGTHYMFRARIAESSNPGIGIRYGELASFVTSGEWLIPADMPIELWGGI